MIKMYIINRLIAYILALYVRIKHMHIAREFNIHISKFFFLPFTHCSLRLISNKPFPV